MESGWAIANNFFMQYLPNSNENLKKQTIKKSLNVETIFRKKTNTREKAWKTQKGIRRKFIEKEERKELRIISRGLYSKGD